MSIDITIFKADREAVRDDLPVTVTFGAQTVLCRQTMLAEPDRAAAAGLLEDYVLSLHSVTDDWSTLPAVGDLLTLDSVEYRVLRLVEDSVGTRFDMGAKFTGRTVR